jgi:hypothetical protein
VAKPINYRPFGERTKAANDPSTEAFAQAVQQMHASQLKSDALRDVGNVGLTALGVGAAGRGLLGLVQMLNSHKPKKTRTGPNFLPLPYPVTAEKTAGFLAGDDAATKGGIPWYGPAMVLGGAGALTAGWRGVDKLIQSRRKREMQGKLDDARQQFHDALLGQYDEPIKVRPEAMQKKLAADLNALSADLSRLFGLFEKAALAEAQSPTEKRAVDLSNAAGRAAGGYGIYAGLTGLLTGSMVYDKIRKRSRRAVIEKALQQRQRQQFMRQPTEILARPEPVLRDEGV